MNEDNGIEQPPKDQQLLSTIAKMRYMKEGENKIY